MEKIRIRLSPLVRLKMTFDTEMALDKNDIFGRETYEKYLEIHQQSEAKQEKLVRSLFFTDVFLFLVINGQNWKIPVPDIEIASLPAVQEILLFSATITFFFLCTTFVTNQCYIGIIDQFGNRIANSELIDPDFFNASRKYYDFFLKVFRPKLNFWGTDIYHHEKGFKAFSIIINIVIYAAILVLPLAHVSVVISASLDIALGDWNLFGKWFLLSSVFLINLGGFSIVIGMSKEFDFYQISPDQEVVNKSPNSITPNTPND